MTWPRYPKSKYGAKATVVDGQRFASKKEARVYGDLKVRERLGEIEQVACQVRFNLVVNGDHVCAYVSDFTWVEKATGEFIVADVKSAATATIERYRIKRKLFRAIYGFNITEVN